MSLLILIRHDKTSDKWFRVDPRRFTSHSQVMAWLKERVYEGDLEDGDYYVAPLIFLEELKKRMLDEGDDNGSKR